MPNACVSILFSHTLLLSYSSFFLSFFSLSPPLSSEVTFNCQSNEERYQWMSKIQSAIPNGSDSPQLQAKKVKAEQDPPPASKLVEQPPTLAERQETVDEAALLATKNHTEDGKIPCSTFVAFVMQFWSL